MKKFILLLMFVFSFVGCTTYNSEIKNNSYSPIASVQVLRNIPLLKTTRNILFFDKYNLDSIETILKNSKDIDGYTWLKSTKTEKLYVDSKTIDSFLKNKDKLFTEKIFLNFLYMQDLVNTAGGSSTFDVSENKTTITKDGANFKYNTERKMFFRDEVVMRLLLEEINLTENFNEARYVMNITVFEDGLMDKSKISVGYLYEKTSGIIGLNVEIIDIQEKKIILSYYIKNISIYKDLRILYCIPKITMTEDLEFEY